MRVRASVRRLHHRLTVDRGRFLRLLRHSRAPKNSSPIDGAGGRGETRACDRVRRRVVHVRARAHPARPATTRPPNSDLVRTASYVSRRPVDHDRATTQSDNAPAAVLHSRAFVDRYQTVLISIRNIVTAIVGDFPFYASRHSAGFFRLRVPGFPVPRSFHTRLAFVGSGHAGVPLL